MAKWTKLEKKRFLDSVGKEMMNVIQHQVAVGVSCKIKTQSKARLNFI